MIKACRPFGALQCIPAKSQPPPLSNLGSIAKRLAVRGDDAFILLPAFAHIGSSLALPGGLTVKRRPWSRDVEGLFSYGIGRISNTARP